MPDHPTIPAALARLTEAARKHTPGQALLPADMPPIWRATARDAGVTIDEVMEWVNGNG
jgi:hypothetical protein